jgi:hypothetical protein
VGRGTEAIAALVFAVAVLLLLFNPVSLDFNAKSLAGLGLLVAFGSLVSLAGMVRVPVHYLAPVAALAVVDLRAAGLFLFAWAGARSVSAREGNTVVPDPRKLAGPAFSGYALFLLVSVALAYPSLEFTIPGAVSGLAVELMSPALGCELKATGGECIDMLVNSAIARQCKGDQDCVSLLNQNRQAIEEEQLRQVKSQFPSFSLNSTVRSALQETLEFQVQELIKPYADVFRLIMAVVLFSVFQFLGGPLALAAGMLNVAALWAFERAGLVEEKTVRVEKTKFLA